jgi:hypothetical protein
VGLGLRHTSLKQNLLFRVYILTSYLSEMGGGSGIGKAGRNIGTVGEKISSAGRTDR